MREVKLQITNPTGLHARPAALFVQAAAGYKSKVRIHGNNKTADAKSILAVMSLGLAQGTDITIVAEGEDEEVCVAALAALITSNFGEG
ncbi:MAG TPA: HPr family phosphocarrier protein [Selenomonadales bacterium]|nr:HPr family phosphocarrier protein [Selenomonadales bacterium]